MIWIHTPFILTDVMQIGRNISVFPRVSHAMGRVQTIADLESPIAALAALAGNPAVASIGGAHPLPIEQFPVVRRLIRNH